MRIKSTAIYYRIEEKLHGKIMEKKKIKLN